jgi:hypothetical protein
MEAIMFMPIEIIVIASLALTLLLIAGSWSVAVPDVEDMGKIERLRFPAPHESAFRYGVRNRSMSAVIAIMSASVPVANR